MVELTHPPFPQSTILRQDWQLSEDAFNFLVQAAMRGLNSCTSAPSLANSSLITSATAVRYTEICELYIKCFFFHILLFAVIYLC